MRMKEFRANPYFENKELKVEYRDHDTKVTATPIQWKPQKVSFPLSN